ncbi:glycogen/starch/alpha-glucan phosphorylase, partial [Chlamydiota bacterium]
MNRNNNKENNEDILFREKITKNINITDKDAHTGMDLNSLRTSFMLNLNYSLAKDKYSATSYDRFFALAMAVRDRLIQRWIKTQQTYHTNDVKRVYYLSLEFMMGRALGNNIISMGIEESCRNAMKSLGLNWDEMRDEEVDAGLGNGGLGRLAACFLDSLATLCLPATGYGLRYDYGIFNQAIRSNEQVELPDNWLRLGCPWEIARPEFTFTVHLYGRVEKYMHKGMTHYKWIDTRPVIGVPYDYPIIGYKTNNVNNLRLWSAKATEEFDFEDFNQGDYEKAVEHKVLAENITKVLYPNDNTYRGKELRLKQQYFFVSCTIQDIMRRYLNDHDDLNAFTDKVAIQLNDTHPSLAIAELMRIFIDDFSLPWELAWEKTVAVFGYTNHTLLPEALEKWSVSMFEILLPRHLQIIYEINRRFLRHVANHYPHDIKKIQRMSLIDESDQKQVRMAHLAIIGSHSINGVSELHTKLLKTKVMPEFFKMFPERFNNKTNGITQRRWLLKANPSLAELITHYIGDEWIIDLNKLKQLEKYAEDDEFQNKFNAIKSDNKSRLTKYILENNSVLVDPTSLFDVHVKRIHEYKRQLLNILHILVLYVRLKNNKNVDLYPHTFIFAGKAAPGYFIAKLIIKFINEVAQVINNDDSIKDKLKVVFLANYRVSLAEKIIPAADLSEQISMAGTEASGTGNMKFALNGALTIGTLDGANIEIKEEVGDENIFIFGLTAKEIEEIKHSKSYDPESICS